MTTQIKRRRGTTTQHSTFAGAEAELTVDTDKNTVVVHDGATAGGFPLAKESGSSFTNVDINSGTIDGTTIGATTPAEVTGTTITGSTLVSTGNITVSGTVDGRDVAADGTKLDGIEAGADVTDTANVTAAGALMDSELTNITAVKALDQGVATTDSPNFSGLTVDTNTLFVDAANNRVGVGTSSPLTKGHFFSGTSMDQLSVDGTGAIETGINFKNSGGTYGQIYFNNVSPYDMSVMQQYTTGSLVFGTNDTERMRITSSGSVGIGASSPVTNLHLLKPTSGLSGVQISNSTYGSTITDGLFVGVDDAHAYVYNYENNPLLFATNNTERMRIDSSGGLLLGTTSNPNSYRAIFQGKNATTSIGGEALLNLADGNANGERSNIRFTTSTDGPLAVISANAVTGGSYPSSVGLLEFGVQNGGGTTTAMSITSTGNVGIGTSSPSAPLTIGYSGAEAQIQINNSGGNRMVYLGAYSENEGILRLFNSSNVETVRIPSESTAGVHTYFNAGNVGIGTSSPSDGRLHVVAGSAATGNSLFVSNLDGTYNPYLQIQHDGVNGVKLYTSSSWGGTAGNLTINPANSTIFQSSGSEKMRIDSSGNVGIGTSSPTSRLTVSDGSSGLTPFSGTDVFIDSSSSNYLQFGSGSASAAAIYFGDSADGDVGGIIYSHATDALSFRANAAERMRIDASGNLLVGTTSQINTTKTSISASSSTNGLGIQNANDSNYLITALNSSSAEVFRVAGTGNVLNTNNSYGGLSDARLKSDIVDASSQLNDIMSLQVRSYTLNSTGEKHLGVVAQELEVLGMSGLVEEDKEGTKYVKYSVLYMKAVKALQEAIIKIDDLEARITALEA